MDDFTQNLVKEINKVRSDPQSYKPLMRTTEQQFAGNTWKRPGNNIWLETNSGSRAVRETNKFL